MHKDPAMTQYRLWLHPDTVRQVKAYALLTGADGRWNMLFDEVARAGIAYLNELRQLKMAEWDPNITLYDLKNVPLRTIRGTLPRLEDDN